MKTFSRDAWNEAQAAWTVGEFSDEWKPYRHQAAMRGMIYPPEGTRFDSWEDDEPSQRAILIRAIRETPNLLSAAINASRTWGGVVSYIVRARDEWRDEIRRADRSVYAEPDAREATVVLKAIIDRIANS